MENTVPDLEKQVQPLQEPTLNFVDLSDDLILKIFNNLTNDDIKNVALVHKRFKSLANNPSLNTSDNAAGILDLPDDIILQILKNLDSHDIVSVGLTNRRLWRVTHDHTLWDHADFIQSGHKYTKQEAKMALTFICSKTKTLRIAGKDESIFTQSMIKKIKDDCPELRVLELHDWIVTLSIEHFPRKLWRLSLSGSHPSRKWASLRNDSYATTFGSEKGSRSYLYGLCQVMPYLQSLDLSRCKWMDNHSLLAVSKIPYLRELSLQCCCRVGGSVAYTALATGMGFPSLERLDVRGTVMDDMDVKNFLTKTGLEELYIGKFLACSPEPREPLSEELMEMFENTQLTVRELPSINNLIKVEDLESSDSNNECTPNKKIKKDSSVSIEINKDHSSDSDDDQITIKCPSYKNKFSEKPSTSRAFDNNTPGSSKSLVNDRENSKSPDSKMDASSDSSSDDDLNVKATGSIKRGTKRPRKMRAVKIHRNIQNRKNGEQSTSDNGIQNVWQQYVGGYRENDDIEDVVENGGRNVIVLNCTMGTPTFTHVTVPSGYPMLLLKSVEPGAEITSDLVIYVSNCIKLQVLAVAGTNISDSFLQHLMNHELKNLKLIDIRQTNLSSSTVRQFQNAFPSVKWKPLELQSIKKQDLKVCDNIKSV